MRDHLPVILFLVPFATAICLPMVGLKARGWCRPLALVSLLVMFVLAAGNLLLVLKHGEQSYGFAGWSTSASPPLGIVWVNDGLAAVMLVTISFLASLCLLYSGPLSPVTETPRIVPYYALILLLISALTGIVFAGDIFNVFVFLEVAALSAYALVALAGGRALIAAFRYLILGTLGSTFYLLGVVFFYATTGTLNMEDISQQFTKNPELLHSKAIVGGMAFPVPRFGYQDGVVSATRLAPRRVHPRAGCDLSPAGGTDDEGRPVWMCSRPVLGSRCRFPDRTRARTDSAGRTRHGGCAGRLPVGISATGAETDVCLWWHLPHRTDSDWS